MSPRPDVSDERRTQILEAAMTVFDQARMDDIAQEFGLSKGALYLYYKSKDATLSAILQFFFSRAMKKLQGFLEVDRGFRQPEGNQSERFHVLALAFFEQDVEPEGGFARTGQTGQDNELVLGDCKGDIFQVMQPSAANSDVSSHLAPSDLQGVDIS